MSSASPTSTSAPISPPSVSLSGGSGGLPPSSMMAVNGPVTAVPLSLLQQQQQQAISSPQLVGVVPSQAAQVVAAAAGAPNAAASSRMVPTAPFHRSITFTIMRAWLCYVMFLFCLCSIW
jgi:hypothetical protein